MKLQGSHNYTHTPTKLVYTTVLYPRHFNLVINKRGWRTCPQ